MSAVDPRSSSTPEAAGETQASSHAAEAGVGEGSAGAGQGDSPEVEVVAGDSAGGVPVILPAPVYNKKEEVVEVDRGVVDAVDRFRAPADFVRKGSRDKSFMYSLVVYVENTDPGRKNHKFYCLANADCRRKTKVVPCTNGDRSNVNTHLKSAHNMQGTAGVVKARKKQAKQVSIAASLKASANSGLGTNRCVRWLCACIFRGGIFIFILSCSRIWRCLVL